MKYLVVLVSVLVTATAQRHCCMPEEHQGEVVSVLGFHTATDTDAILVYDSVYVDFLRQRLAMIHRMKLPDGRQDEVKIIDNFFTRKRMTIRGETCTITPLEERMRLSCIPAEARFLGELTLGSGSEMLAADNWEMINGTRRVQWINSHEGCVPTTIRAWDKGTPDSFMLAVNVVNVIPEVTNHDVFEPPEECRVVAKEPELPASIKAMQLFFTI